MNIGQFHGVPFLLTAMLYSASVEIQSGEKWNVDTVAGFNTYKEISIAIGFYKFRAPETHHVIRKPSSILFFNGPENCFTMLKY